MTAEYTPTTDNGTGFLVPILKAVQHIHNIALATGLELPMTIEVARSELDHAIVHANDVATIGDIVTRKTHTNINHWIAHVRDAQSHLAKLEGADPDTVITKDNLGEARDALKAIETEAWALLSSLDIELLGWAPERTDAGRLA